MTSTPETVGERLIRLLECHGVTVVFGIPGVHTIELYRGLERSSIRHITPRSEAGAGFMADGYARATGRPGVAFTVSGPGLVNILTPMGQAYGCSVPLLVISSVNAHGRMGSGEGWLHELKDQSGMAAGVAAFSRTIHRPSELAPALEQAFAVFDAARPRPVHLEIPTDVMAMPAEGPDRAPAPLARPVPPADLLDEAAAMLAGAARPLILAGGGAGADLAPLAEALDAPVVMTANGRGRLAPDHPLAVPLNPSLPEVRALMAAADVVLGLGTELGPTDYDWNEDGGFTLPGALIRADIDPMQIRRGAAATLGLVGDASATAEALMARLPRRRSSADGSGPARAAAARRARDGLPARVKADLSLLDALRDALPGALIVGDSTQLSYAGNLGAQPDRAGGYWSSASGFGTLGYGMPAAIGAAIGAPQCPIIALCGDGGFMFTAGEMPAAAEAGARVIVLLHDNGGYGEIETHMRAAGVTPVGVSLTVPDFPALAAACGWHSVAVNSRAALIAAVTKAASAQGPTLIRFDDRARDG